MSFVHVRARALLTVGVLATSAGMAPAIASASTAQTVTGTQADGATYKIEVPADWNHTLVLYSHGYTVGRANPATDVGDPATGAWLLGHGYALAGSSYATTGWALQQAIPDQIDVLNIFARKVGTPTRTIAWGHSLGGMITAALVQSHPDRFAGAIPMCGVVGGGIGAWNQALDGTYAFKVLTGATNVELVNVSNPAASFNAAEAQLALAQTTPQGRARVALAAAVSDIPGWFAPATPEPAASDVTTQELNQAAWFGQVDFFFSSFGRAELESRAGGNYSWNTGIDYRRQLAQSVDLSEVNALYQAAGLNLDADLRALDGGPRVAVSDKAEEYVQRWFTYDGDLDMPVLTMHTTGDGLVQVEHEQAYAEVVQSASDSSLLRQTYVHRAGHCSFTPAETITAFKTMVNRLDTGRWADTTGAPDMNATAASLGPAYGPSAFIRFRPADFLRPFFGDDRRG